MSYENKSFGDTFADALYGMARWPASATNSFGTGVSPDKFTSDYLNEFSNRLSNTARSVANLGGGAGGIPTISEWIPGWRNVAMAFDPNADMSAAQRALNAAGGAAALTAGSLVTRLPVVGQAIQRMPLWKRFLGGAAGYSALEPAATRILPEQYRSQAPSIFDAAQRSWQQTQQAAAAMGTNTTPTVPIGAPERAWAQTQLAGALMGTNITPPSLTPSEIEYFAQQQRDLRRRAGQAAAQDKLQTQQAKQEAQRQIADLRAFMGAAPQDVAAQTTSLGPAAELGFLRTVEREGGEKIGDVRQNLRDYLARQKLAASQRGANVSAGMSDIEKAKAAALLDREKQLDYLFGGMR